MGKAYQEYLKKEKISKDFAKDVADMIAKIFSKYTEKDYLSPEDLSNQKARDQYFDQAKVHEMNKEYEKALELYEVAGNLGHAEACFNAAEYYSEGVGCAINPTRAFNLYERSVKLLHFPANSKLAECYLYGYGTNIDIEKGLELLEIGTFVEDENCIEMLADIYEKGEFVETDYELADYLRSKIFPEGIA